MSVLKPWEGETLRGRIEIYGVGLNTHRILICVRDRTRKVEIELSLDEADRVAGALHHACRMLATQDVLKAGDIGGPL